MLLAIYDKENRNILSLEDLASKNTVKKIKKISELLNLSYATIILFAEDFHDEEKQQIEKLNKNSNKVLILSTKPNVNEAREYLALGVYGYANTYMGTLYLNSAIQMINQGLIWVLPEVSSQILRDLTKDSRDDIRFQEHFSVLTNTEEKVANLILDGLKNQDISEKLDISINTVKKHIKNIYEKLNVTNRASFSNLFN